MILSITISGLILFVHSNCLSVPLWSGHHIQSLAFNLCLLKHPLHTNLFITLYVFVEVSLYSSLNPDIKTIVPGEVRTNSAPETVLKVVQQGDLPSSFYAVATTQNKTQTYYYGIAESSFIIDDNIIKKESN